METSKEYKCTFCGNNNKEVKILIGGQTTESFICDICVGKCYNLILKKGTEASSGEEIDDVTFDEIDVTDVITPKHNEGMPAPSEIKAYLDQYIVGQDDAKITVAVAAYNHYKRITNPIVDDIEIEKSNILLVGPTASGKTLIAQTLANFLQVPYAMADATSLTEAGYVGEDVESIIGRLLVAADYDVALCEHGIIFLDEIDKKRSAKSAGTARDVSGEGVQQALLKLLEGSEVMISPPGKKNADRVKINTKNILFVVSGAFVGLDKIVNKEKKAIGFSSKNEEVALTHLLRGEHLIEFGLIPEMVGRLPVIGVLSELTEDQLFHVLTEPKNAITKQFKALFKIDGVELEFTKEALLSIASKAILNKTGARGLRGLIEASLLHTQFKLPEMRASGVEMIVVGEKVFTEGKEPEVKFRKTI